TSRSGVPDRRLESRRNGQTGMSALQTSRQHTLLPLPSALMRYRILGRTGLRVSVIGVGTWQMGGEWGHDYTQAEADAIFDKAAECGINLIDTADCDGAHVSERLIGDYLSRRDRSRWIVATKFGHHFNSFMNRTDEFSPEKV